MGNWELAEESIKKPPVKQKKHTIKIDKIRAMSDGELYDLLSNLIHEAQCAREEKRKIKDAKKSVDKRHKKLLSEYNKVKDKYMAIKDLFGSKLDNV